MLTACVCLYAVTHVQISQIPAHNIQHRSEVSGVVMAHLHSLLHLQKEHVDEYSVLYINNPELKTVFRFILSFTVVL